MSISFSSFICCLKCHLCFRSRYPYTSRRCNYQWRCSQKSGHANCALHNKVLIIKSSLQKKKINFLKAKLNSLFFSFISIIHFSVKSLRHRVQVHLEILHSVRRMVFGVSMSKSGMTTHRLWPFKMSSFIALFLKIIIKVKLFHLLK